MTHQPDVVLMDIRMPRCDGITATARELRANPAQAIIVLTTFDADENVVRALQAGARGFLLKDAPPAELVAAVHEAASGRPALAAQVLEQVIRITAHHAQLPNEAERLAVASSRPASATSPRRWPVGRRTPQSHLSSSSPSPL